jgi:hypothetical protein
MKPPFADIQFDSLSASSVGGAAKSDHRPANDDPLTGQRKHARTDTPTRSR